MKNKTVTLIQPLKRGETEINEIRLIKPNVNALKGLKMFDVMQMDVDAYCQLLPRITQPSLGKVEILNLDPIDFTALCSETIGFFVKTETNEETAEDMTAELQA
ncbi:phage tail protein [Canicola haemoglobinophilus]|uniref:Phage tail E family protein n=1 Tax=Canicola haemoglobinophilus TaxID=733 RepID=A0A1V4AZZ3_9PAST|nr:phage tail assembly protein [Canicola haemoglobinophilus]OOR99097.1 phage tail protein [Canicola haemoglobinophilus]STO55663.1 phage tail E family protein [Canicola haemoglobinophilus]STO58837.1 phage tail E family protein [Canicola haemoglobinophilus]STO67989.1 phage tail E family protein [Canicola haemoglobinophilus]